MVLMFELPIAGILQPVPDPNAPSIQRISQTYSISVSFKQRSRMYGATVIVRGSQNNTDAVKVGNLKVVQKHTSCKCSFFASASQAAGIVDRHMLPHPVQVLCL